MLGLEGQQGLGLSGEVDEAAELGDDAGLDASAHVGRYLRVGDLVGAAAFAVAFKRTSGASRPATSP